jgi:hypothetical protein
MQRIFVLDQQNRPLMPCLPARPLQRVDGYRYVQGTRVLPPLTDVGTHHALDR